MEMFECLQSSLANFGQVCTRYNFHYYAAVGVGLILIQRVYSKYTYSVKRKRWDSAGKDVVLIHQFNRSKFTPSLSPFPIKLETYCRMAGLKYKVDMDDPMSSKGKCPWMTINGKDIADTQFCIEYLNRKFMVDLNKKLTPEEKSIAHSFRILIEDHFYWPLALWRWSFDDTNSVLKVWEHPFIVKLLKPLIGKGIRDASKGQGIGRHCEQDIYKIGIEDLRVLSTFLGKKRFLMGDEPCEADCAIFGSLVQVVWNVPGCPFETLVHKELSNLKDYVYRMKERFWPDWDDVVKSGETDFTKLKLN